MIWNKIKAHQKSLIVTGLIGIFAFSIFAFSDKDFKIAKNLDIFITLFREIDLYYVDENDPEDLINAGINGILEVLDPYTTYIPESDMDEFKFMTTGQYGGIGALIRKAGDYSIISEPYEGFPAQKAGLIAGDTLISINGISIKSKNISDVSELLKGTPKTELKITIKRPGDSISFEINFLRDKITIKNVPYYGIIDENIGYIRLSNFTKNASSEVKSAFKYLKEQGAESIVLDLRVNPGGLLDESVEIANIWIDKDQEIVSTRGKAKQWDQIYKTNKLPLDTLIPIAILVNRGSASASEIVAGSLQDLDRAIVVGQRTFGKGLVQVTRPLSYNTHLKLTTAKYYIPSGRCIQALDYSHRNDDGSVGHIPDSLISEFRTKNGRIVYDGGGIKPDVNVDYSKPAYITYSLYAKNLIFDFATLYAIQNDSIAPPDQFILSDNIYKDFLLFLKDREFEYNSQSSIKLDDLITISKKEGYYDLAEAEIEALRKKLDADNDHDLMNFRDEIGELLRDEIISRYFYQKGRIIAGLQNDKQLDKAIELLKEPGAISSILHGTYEFSDIKFALER